MPTRDGSGSICCLDCVVVDPAVGTPTVGAFACFFIAGDVTDINGACFGVLAQNIFKLHTVHLYMCAARTAVFKILHEFIISENYLCCQVALLCLCYRFLKHHG